MGHRFEIWDVFTQTRFAGNQLAVVYDADDLTTDEMQAITKEFNFAESSFILSPEKPENTARVRIFTPEYEMPFAGHPTVGTALAIAHDRDLHDSLLIELKAGLFPVALDRVLSMATFTNPNVPVEVDGVPTAAVLEQAMGLASGALDQAAHRPRRINAGVTFLYARASLGAVISARVNSSAFEALGLRDTIGILLYAPADPVSGADWHVRMFAPEAGVLEDAATGSAAAGLPGQLERAGMLAEGCQRLVVEQGVEMGRPSRIDLMVSVENSIVTEVRVGGRAVRVASGTLV